MSKPSRGIVMFAHNNTEIDYFKLAVTNALLIQKHMGLTPDQITVVTDPYSLDFAKQSLGEELVDSAIGNIVIAEKNIKFKDSNIRVYKDTAMNPKQLSFYNVNRSDVYSISPYDETIVIDVDYIILSDKLNQCWGHNNDFMMNWQFKDAMAAKGERLERVSSAGITQYWATVIYFKRTPYAESIFELVKHIRDNIDYYKDIYGLPGTLFRNDFAFSIAAHMMGGFKDRQIPQLPATPLYKTFDIDDVHSVDPATGAIKLFLEKPGCPGDFILTSWRGVDIHIMNKWALNRISEGLLTYAKETR